MNRCVESPLQIVFKGANNALLIDFFLSRTDEWLSQKEISKSLSGDYNSQRYRENLMILTRYGLLEKKSFESESPKSNKKVFKWRMNSDDEAIQHIHSFRNALIRKI